MSTPTVIKEESFLLKWTPRAIAIAIGGYYGLGIAYELGLMALIDRVAIDVLKHFVGYAGVGALMPTFQWYSAWAVRIAIGAVAGVIYHLFEKALSYLKEAWDNREILRFGSPRVDVIQPLAH